MQYLSLVQKLRSVRVKGSTEDDWWGPSRPLPFGNINRNSHYHGARLARDHEA